MEALINRSITSYKKRNRNADISYSMKDVHIKVNVDDLWIEQLLVNLYSNAYDAIPDDRNGQVSIDVGMDQAYLMIRVSDNGIGISPEMKEKIFDFGISTKTDHRMRGIGLYLCKQIAEAHNGELSVEKSELDVGSTFIIKFPLAISTM